MSDPALSAEAMVPTEHGSRYLQQLCKHWEHSLDVTFTSDHGVIVFPRDARGADWPTDGRATLVASEAHLTVRIDASNEAHLDALEGVLQRHLDRFAFREAPLAYDWKPA